MKIQNVEFKDVGLLLHSAQYSCPKQGFETSGPGENLGDLRDACKRHTERLRVGVKQWEMDEAYPEPRSGQWRYIHGKIVFVTDISDKNPC